MNSINDTSAWPTHSLSNKILSFCLLPKVQLSLTFRGFGEGIQMRGHYYDFQLAVNRVSLSTF